jgi:hypothetical protein
MWGDHEAGRVGSRAYGGYGAGQKGRKRPAKHWSRNGSSSTPYRRWKCTWRASGGGVDVVDASTLATHGGGWGDEDPDRQLAKGMQLGRLWGAEQGWAEVQIRRRAKPPDTQLSATETLELVAGYANAPKMILVFNICL